MIKNLFLSIVLCCIHLCLYTQVMNDECIGAIPLTVNTTAECNITYTSTLVEATGAVPQGDLNCSGYSYNETYYNDVWFSFVAENSVQKISINSETENGLNYLFFVYNASSCNAVSPVACSYYAAKNIENLVIGNTYYIRVFSRYEVNPNLISFFNICVSKATPNPINDECSSALELIPNEFDTCVYYHSVDLTNATLSSNFVSCNANSGHNDDVWFKFTATSNDHILSILNLSASYMDLMIALYKGSCDDNNLVFCYEQDSISLRNLVIGDVYYLRIYTKSASSSHNTSFDLCLSTPLAPINDECENAILLNVNQDNDCDLFTRYTTFGATLSSTPIPVSSCDNLNYTDIDVWFKFVATNSSHIVSNFGYSYYIYKNDCNSLELIESCSRGSKTLENLTLGETYYIRVVSEWGAFSEENICVKTENNPVSNDECTQAVSVTVHDDMICLQQTQVDFTHATTDIGQGTNDKHIWYQFVANAHVQILTISNFQYLGSLSEHIYARLYKNCSNLPTYIYPSDTMAIYSLDIDSTYFIQITLRLDSVTDYQNTTFDICLLTPDLLVNDECETAISIPVNEGQQCLLSVAGNVSFANSSFNDSDKDIWYKFTATHTEHILSLTYLDSNINQVDIDFYKNDCQNLMSLVPNFQRYETNIARRFGFSNLTIGETYYVRVYSDVDYTSGNFELCVFSPPINDNCDGAISLIVNESSNCVSTNYCNSTGSFPSTLSYCGTSTSSSYDSWYKFVATSNIHNIMIDQADFDFYIYNASCGTLGSPIACYDITYPSNYVYNLTPGQEYLVRVKTGYEYIPFELCITTPSVNPHDECTTRGTIPVNLDHNCDTLTQINFQNATISPEYSGGLNYSDVWYTFTATDSILALRFFNFSQNSFNFRFSFYKGSCGNLVNLNLNATPPTSFAQYNTAFNILRNLVIGQVYTFRFSEITGNLNNNFDICIAKFIPAPNDLCGGAIELPVNSDLECDSVVNYTFGNTLYVQNNTWGLNCSNSTVYRDIWFKFTATHSKHTIASLAVQWELFQNDCESLDLVACSPNSSPPPMSWEAENLIPGNTYFLRLVNRYNVLNEAIASICIGTRPVPSNDNCENAITLQSSFDANCSSPTSGTLFNSTPSLDTNFCENSSDDDDVWYKFVASSTSHVLQLNSNLNTNDTIKDLYFSVYHGDCGSFTTTIACVDSNYTFLDNLIIGETYYIRVYTATSESSIIDEVNFQICLGKNLYPPACLNSTPAGNTCSEALSVCSLKGYCGTTSAAYTADTWTEFSSSFCGTIENNSFLSFYADSNILDLNVWVTSSLTGLGIQLFVFDADSCQGNVVSKLCWDPHYVPVGHSNLKAHNLIPGKKYYMMIDGQSGDVCDYIIDSNADLLRPLLISSDTNQICLGDSVLVTVQGGNSTYHWQETPGLRLTSPTTAYFRPISTELNSFMVNSYVGSIGCEESSSLMYQIQVNECFCPIFASNNSDSCVNRSFDLFSNEIFNASYLWSGPNGFSSTEQNPQNIIPPTTPGVYPYVVSAINVSGGGCIDTTFVLIRPYPNANFSYSQSSYCLGDVNPTPIKEEFNFGVFETSIDLPIDSITGELNLVSGLPGTYIIGYTVNNGTCPQYSSQLINIFSPPVITFNTNFTNFCSDQNEFPIGIAWPVPGTYSGPGIINDWLVPSSLEPGFYELTYTYTDPLSNCTASDNVTIQISNCLGSEEVNNSLSFKISPNPANDQIHVVSDDKFEIQLLDSKGKTVYIEKNASLQKDISLIGYESGIYYVVLTSEKYSMVDKLIIIK